MNFKIDTKEKFTVITPEEIHLSDNLTEQLINTAKEILQKDKSNVVLNLKQIKTVNDEAAAKLVNLQQSFYENNTSFVICEMQTSLAEKFEELDLLELMNITPSESEAWDIVQMEEMERELLNGDDEL
ncbi:MAG TPA: STAS domain-containing protein [Panacibacter sp.]|nr:STAS domain-containing protein [Panacibacter sp.]HNP42762.1 STAS domain-containing protein [Panacibacter sp.]